MKRQWRMCVPVALDHVAPETHLFSKPRLSMQPTAPIICSWRQTLLTTSDNWRADKMELALLVGVLLIGIGGVSLAIYGKHMYDAKRNTADVPQSDEHD